MTTIQASGPTTRRQAKKLEFDHVIKTLCDLDDTSSFVLFLDEIGIDNVGDLLAISDHEIEQGLEFTDPKDTTRRLKVPNRLKKIPRILCAFYTAECEDAGRTMTWLELKPEDYDNFRVTAYNPDEIILPFRKLKLGLTQTQTANAPVVHNIQAVPNPLEASFFKGIKCSSQDTSSDS